MEDRHHPGALLGGLRDDRAVARIIDCLVTREARRRPPLVTLWIAKDFSHPCGQEPECAVGPKRAIGAWAGEVEAHHFAPHNRLARLASFTRSPARHRASSFAAYFSLRHSPLN